MTSHVARLYALVLGVFVFFVSWAAVVAHPWATTATAAKDPRIAALVARQQRVQRESLRVQQVLQARSATGKSPAVKIVNLPPLTVTRVS